MLWRNESETIYFITMLKILANEEKSQSLINLRLIDLRFWHLKNKPATLLILFIFPFGFYTMPKKLNGVYFFEASIDLISKYQDEYTFCLLSSLRK